MRKSRFTDSQIMAMLKQNEDGAAVADICRDLPLSFKNQIRFRFVAHRCFNLDETHLRVGCFYPWDRILLENSPRPKAASPVPSG